MQKLRTFLCLSDFVEKDFIIRIRSLYLSRELKFRTYFHLTLTGHGYIYTSIMFMLEWFQTVENLCIMNMDV